MATRSDAPDPAVDELRRKARRRLVGAVVLALAAAVALPLLLENEPKPLGDDVSIQIPPVDTGKFVNPLSPVPPPDAKLKGDKSAAGSSETAPAAPQPSATNESTKAEPTKTEPAKTEPAKQEPTQPAPPPSVAGPAAPEPKPAPVPAEPKADAKPLPSADTSPEAQKSAGPFVVQVAAFSDRFGARSLVAKLKKGGFPGYIETVSTDKGTLHRVRVGPYPSREVADAARTRLKTAGFPGVVARSG
jgi:DedD protein